MKTFEEPKITCQVKITCELCVWEMLTAWSNKTRDNRKSAVINDDLLTIIESKLKYNAVNQLITKWQLITR